MRRILWVRLCGRSRADTIEGQIDACEDDFVSCRQPGLRAMRALECPVDAPYGGYAGNAGGKVQKTVMPWSDRHFPLHHFERSARAVLVVAVIIAGIGRNVFTVAEFAYCADTVGLGFFDQVGLRTNLHVGLAALTVDRDFAGI